MEITDIRIRKVDCKKNDKLKAFVAVTFDGIFVVDNIKIIDGKHGIFLSMPAVKTEDGLHTDIAHPITSAFRRKFHEQILEKYNASFNV